ncbi:MAG TPA: 30S ribosomal protein S12, partial [bacterium]|nr:30S ribosomal protein S12 [bacterium]
RGALDSAQVEGRKKSRSRYGTKKLKQQESGQPQKQE